MGTTKILRSDVHAFKANGFGVEYDSKGPNGRGLYIATM